VSTGTRRHRRRQAAALLALAAFLAVLGLAHAQRPPRSLTGRLLVATDAMTDTRFGRTVIYLVPHDASADRKSVV